MTESDEKHLTHDCCIVCDSEIAYTGYGAEAKTMLCPPCRVKFPPSATVSQSAFIELLSSLPNSVIDCYEFVQCAFPNPIDEYLTHRGIFGSFEESLEMLLEGNFNDDIQHTQLSDGREPESE